MEIQELIAQLQELQKQHSPHIKVAVRPARDGFGCMQIVGLSWGGMNSSSDDTRKVVAIEYKVS